VCLVDEDVNVLPGVSVFVDSLELMDHRDDQAAFIGLDEILHLGLGVGPPDRDILALHLAEELLDPALKLAFELGAIYHQDDGGILEARLVLKNQACCGK